MTHAAGTGKVGVHAHVGDDHAGAHVAGDDVDGGAAGGEVVDHGRRDLRREGAHAFCGDAVVAGHDGDRLAFYARLRLSLNPGELDRQRLQAAERPGRFGELHLARLGRPHGIGVERPYGRDGPVEQVGHGSRSLGENGSTAEAFTIEHMAGEEEVDAVGHGGESLVGAPELVAVEARERVLGHHAEADLVGDRDQRRAGLGDGGEQILEAALHACRGGALLFGRQQRVVVVEALVGWSAAAKRAA